MAMMAAGRMALALWTPTPHSSSKTTVGESDKWASAKRGPQDPLGLQNTPYSQGMTTRTCLQEHGPWQCLALFSTRRFSLNILIIMFGIRSCTLDVLVILFCVIWHYQSTDQKVINGSILNGSWLMAQGSGQGSWFLAKGGRPGTGAQGARPQARARSHER